MRCIFQPSDPRLLTFECHLFGSCGAPADARQHPHITAALLVTLCSTARLSQRHALIWSVVIISGCWTAKRRSRRCACGSQCCGSRHGQFSGCWVGTRSSLAAVDRSRLAIAQPRDVGQLQANSALQLLTACTRSRSGAEPGCPRGLLLELDESQNMHAILKCSQA